MLANNSLLCFNKGSSYKTIKSDRYFYSLSGGIQRKHLSINKFNITSTSHYFLQCPIRNLVVANADFSDTNDMICVPLDVYINDAVKHIFLGVYLSILAYNIFLLTKNR